MGDVERVGKFANAQFPGTQAEEDANPGGFGESAGDFDEIVQPPDISVNTDTLSNHSRN